MLSRIVHKEFALGDTRRSESFGLADVRPSLQKPAMDVADHVRLGQRKKISSLAQPTIGNKQMSAGRYTILTVGDGSIAIQDRDTGASALSLARTESRRNVSPKLVFHHVGNHYFLAQIWSGVGGAGLIVPSSKLEKELQIAKAPSSSPEEVVIALK